jgi:hypothetical protein
MDRKHFVLFLIFLGYLLCYVDRMVMATAIPYIGKDLHLSKTAMGAVMSAFFIGYTAFQIPAGVLVDRYGARKTMTVAVTMWTLFTALTGNYRLSGGLVGWKLLYFIHIHDILHHHCSGAGRDLESKQQPGGLNGKQYRAACGRQNSVGTARPVSFYQQGIRSRLR